MPDWKQKRGWINRTLEKVEDVPDALIYGDSPVSDSAKRELFERGIPGRATVLKAPPKSRLSTVQRNVSKFTVQVEVEGRDPYEAITKQSFGEYDHERLQKGAVVECRVDPEDDQKVLLIVPEPDEMRVMDSATIVAEGRRARGTVSESAPIEGGIPDSDDPAYLINLDLSSGEEPEPWRVQIAKRVPKGAEDLVAAGSELEVAYMEVDKGDSVAIDWPATSDGKFS